MSMPNPFPKLLWTIALGGLAGIGLGCVISVGPLDCSECGNTGCNSQVVNGECRCDPGYQFANDDAEDFDCDRIPGKGGDSSCGGEANVHLEGDVCVCDNGYNWCNPADLDDLSCCLDDNQAPGTETDADPTTAGTASDTADTSADETVDDTGEPPGMCEEVETPWNGVEPDPADCADEYLVFCSNTEAEGPAGSRFWECLEGAWVENTTFGDEDCQFGNQDFAVGCIDTEDEGVVHICADGPGTPCSGPECDTCVNDDELQYCQDGKLAAASCLFLCTEDPEAKVQYDHGFCLSESGVTDCFCCNEGDEGCPI